MLKGKVILAAAGPGDPDLITVKAARALAEADVILVDRLASSAILDRYANPLAEIIEVGKQFRKEGSTPQAKISTMLLEYAVKGRTVVRLKGGDVSIYSNILDELEILAAYQIPFEIIPGVTAALGAAAYAGIPLTARGLSTGVRFLTYYKDDAIARDEWTNLAHTNDTLVFYMSSNPLALLAARLLSAGASPAKPLAIVEQATTPSQRVTLFTLESCLHNKTDFLSPALVIIGEVVDLHKRFNWFEAGEPDTAYFNELTSIAPTVQTVQK